MHVDLVASLSTLESGGTTHPHTHPNTSTSTGSKACIGFWNIGLFNIHLLEEFFISLEELSVLVFKVPDRYSAVSVTWLAKQNPNIYIATWIVCFLSLPCLPNKLCCLIVHFRIDC